MLVSSGEPLDAAAHVLCVVLVRVLVCMSVLVYMQAFLCVCIQCVL